MIVFVIPVVIIVTATTAALIINDKKRKRQAMYLDSIRMKIDLATADELIEIMFRVNLPRQLRDEAELVYFRKYFTPSNSPFKNLSRY
jgi:hypothetical protein